MHRNDRPNYSDEMRDKGYVLIPGLGWMYAGRDDGSTFDDLTPEERRQAELYEARNERKGNQEC